MDDDISCVKIKPCNYVLNGKNMPYKIMLYKSFFSNKKVQTLFWETDPWRIQCNSVRCCRRTTFLFTIVHGIFLVFTVTVHFFRYTDPSQDPQVYSKKDVRRMPSAPVLPSRDIFRRSNRNNNGIVASESGEFESCVLLETCLLRVT